MSDLIVAAATSGGLMSYDRSGVDCYVIQERCPILLLLLVGRAQNWRMQRHLASLESASRAQTQEPNHWSPT